jgi:hypothetical protein
MSHEFVLELRIVMPAEAGIQCAENPLDSGSQAALRPLPGMTE